MSNVDTVKKMYAAFTRGDITAIIEKLDENVEWDTEVGVTGVPWLEPQRGRGNVPKFFNNLAMMEITKFEPHTFFEQGNKVFTLVRIEATMNGKRYTIPNEGHYFTFTPNGQVANFQHVTDTATAQRMARGE